MTGTGEIGMIDYAQGCRKAFFDVASLQLAFVIAARRCDDRLYLAADVIASLFLPHRLHQRLHAHRHIAGAFARNIS